jgi:hypothetical protein
MNTIIRGLGLLCLLGVVPLARAQEKPPDLKTEYDKLSEQFQAARQEYYKPYEAAKTDAEAEKIHLDPEKDPRKAFLPKFEDLALRAKGSETGCNCWVWVFSNSYDNPEAMQRAFDAIGGEYVTSPALEGFVQRLGWMGKQVGQAKADALLEKILASSPHDSVRAAVLVTQASGLLQDGQGSAEAIAAARARLERVQKEFGKTRYAAQAEGMLFEADHLQIGMAAPDFEAVDQDGKPWKLSDYRGKVVVIDFWGYW